MKKHGFSLIEVNMAVFVMAVGVLALAALYPLGLRESVQSADDLRQSMFADALLNAAVAAASSTNMTWTEWRQVPTTAALKDLTAKEKDLFTSGTVPVPQSVKNAVNAALDAHNNNRGSGDPKMELGENCEMYLFRVSRNGYDQQDDGSPVMGFIVLSAAQDLGQYSNYRRNTFMAKQQLYYAEALFHGNY